MNDQESADVIAQSISEPAIATESTPLKIALGIEYDGSHYYGWQRQNEVRSVQERLEKALSQVANEPISVFVPAELMPEFMQPGRLCTLRQRLIAKMRHGRWGLIPIYHKILPFVG